MPTAEQDIQPVPGRLQGHRILVTGGGDGIGAACARWCAGEGAAVAILDIREDNLERRVAEFEKDGLTALSLACDVTDETSVQRAVAAAAAAFGGLDGVIAAAGIAIKATVEQTSLATWSQMLSVNLTGMFLPIREAIPHLLENQWSSVVTIGSAASLVGMSSSVAYTASKGGVLQLTRGMAFEYGDRGLRANCVCPGPIQTDLFNNSAKIRGVEAGDSILASAVNNPLRRMGTVREVASVVGFLISGEASYVTGAAIPIDGGLTSV